MQIRLFGLLLALLVAVNFVLAVTWLPVSVVCWEKHLTCCASPCACCDSDNDLSDGAFRRARPPPDTTTSLDRPFSIDGNDMPATTPKCAPHSAGTGGNANVEDGVLRTISAAPAAAKMGMHLSEQLDDTTPRSAMSAAGEESRLTGGTHDSRATRGTATMLFGIPIKDESEARAKRCAYLNSRFIWRHIFTVVHFLRYMLVLGLLATSVYGGILASRLKPADSLPQLFHDDNNVQQFINLWSSNFTENGIFSCPSCLAMSASQQLGSLGNGGGGASSGSAVNTSDSGGAVMAALASGGAASNMSPASKAAAAAAAQKAIASGSSPADAASAAATAAAAAAPAGSPQSDLSNINPLQFMPVNRTVLTQKRVNENTIPVYVVWGVAGVKSSSAGSTDSFKVDTSATLEYDSSFDLANAEEQRAIVQQVRSSNIIQPELCLSLHE